MEKKRCYGCMRMKTAASVCEYCGYDERMGNEPHQLAAGTILKEQYLVGKVLGAGGFGITYLGWDMYLDIPVAIKEFFPAGNVMRDAEVSSEVISCSGDAGVQFRNSRERFMREAKMLARFSQVPEIVQVRNFFLANNTAYIVMEYVEGITLKQYVKNQGGKLTADETLDILEPIVRVLGRVHKSGLVHRDISPDNIMMLPDGKAKLLDFGAVRVVEHASPDKALTEGTDTLGKAGYSPLEQYQNYGSLGPWSDVYALCATICYCMSGEVPPSSPERVLEDKDINFADITEDLTEDQIAALNQGMAIRTQDRIASMEELYQRVFGSEEKPAKTERLKKISEKENNDKKVKKDAGKQGGMGKDLGLVTVAATAVVAAVVILGAIFVPQGDQEPGASTAGEQRAEEESQEDIFSGTCGEHVSYTFDPDAQVLHINGEGAMYDYLGTWQLDGEPAENEVWDMDRSMAPWSAFSEEIYSVYIGDGITRIGENAFEQCRNLQDVRFGKDIKSIGWQAFLATGIREAVLPEGLEELEDCAFNYCEKLEKVILPESLKVVDGWTFNECPSLSAVIVGDDTEITVESFYCENHEDRSCLNNLLLYVTPGSKAEETAMNAGYSCKEKAFGWCGPNVAWYVDLDEKCLYLLGWGGTGVYQIGEDTPIEDWLHIMPEEWISRGFPEWVSLYSNKIEKIQVGPYIGELNHRVFNGLIYLKEVDLGSVQSVCAILDGCPVLEEVVVPETVQVMEWDTLAYCEKLRKVTILGENVRIDRGVFRDTPNLEEVYFSKGAVIDDAYGDLFDLNLGGKISPKVTFYVYEGSDAQRYAKKYDIPYEIREEKSLVDEAAGYPTGSCGDDIRWMLNTDNHTLYLEGSGHTWLYRIEDENRKDWENEFPSEWIFSGAPEWCGNENGIYHIVIGDGITHLNHGIFQNLPYLQTVDFGNTVKVIEHSFPWCGLEEISFPEQVCVIGPYTLLWNSSLRKVTFECEDVEIGWGALAACKHLEEVYFPRNAVLVDDVIDPDGNDPYSEHLTFYVYEGSQAHESANWYAEKYGVNISFIEE